MAKEKRLIDANALYEKATDAWDDTLCDECYSEIINLIDEAPTVDAVEVVHGRWVFKNNPITDPKGYFIRIVCSNCNLHTGQKSNYCPQCGAKMDGDGNG